MTCLFLSGFPSTTEATIKRLFSEYGTVHAVRIRRDPNTGQSLGNALIEMPDPAEAANAIAALDQHDWDGRVLYCALARTQRRIADLPNPTAGFCDVYVSALPYEVTADDLEREFSTVGDCRNARIIRYPDGSSRGIAFATMASKDDAERVIHAFNGTDFHGRTISVSLTWRRV